MNLVTEKKIHPNIMKVNDITIAFDD